MGKQNDKAALRSLEYWRAYPFASPLSQAVVDGDMKSFKAALLQGENPNQEEKEGRCPAELAVEFESCEALGLLLEAGAGHFACRFGNNHGFPLAALAASGGWEEGLDILKADGAQMYSKDFVGFRSPLRSAIVYNQCQCVKKLVDWGAAAEPWGSHWDQGGHAPMAHCAMSGRVKLARILHAANPDLIGAPSDNGLRPVHFAAINSQLDFLSWLDGSGADMSVLDDMGKSASAHAQKNGKKKVVHVLAGIAARLEAKAMESVLEGSGAGTFAVKKAKPRI